MDDFIGDILIVDDNTANLQTLSAILKERKHKVRAVTTGQMALIVAHTATPELILLDVNMPEMNGYEVCQRLKADPALHHIPVVFISALDETLDKIKAFRVGGVDYITKPFQIEEVLVRVENHLKLYRLYQQSQEMAALEERRKAIPAARFGKPEEFGEACAYLCSAQAGYITGQNFLIDGGAYPGTF